MMGEGKTDGLIERLRAIHREVEYMPRSQSHRPLLARVWAALRNRPAEDGSRALRRMAGAAASIGIQFAGWHQESLKDCTSLMDQLAAASKQIREANARLDDRHREVDGLKADLVVVIERLNDKDKKIAQLQDGVARLRRREDDMCRDMRAVVETLTDSLAMAETTPV